MRKRGFGGGSGGGSGTISSGTTDYLPKYTGATTIGDSTLSDDGGGEFTWHWGGGNIVRWSAANLAKSEYYYYPAMGNYSLFNTIGVLAPSVSWNGGNRLAGVAVSAPTFSSGSVTTNVATINTTAAHGLTTGDIVTVSGSTGVTVDGTFRVTVVDADTFTYAITVGNGTITAATITPIAQLQIGGAVSSPPTSPLSIGGGTTITGSADAKQLVVKENATQTNPPFQIIDSSGAVISQCNAAGGNIGEAGFSLLNTTRFGGTSNDTAGMAYYGSGQRLNFAGGTQILAWSGTHVEGDADAGFKRARAGFWRFFSGGFSGNDGGGIELEAAASLGTVTAGHAALGCKLVTGTAELFAKDDAGNETQLSPHAKDCPTKFADDQPQDIIIHHSNAYLGTDEWIRLSAMARALEKLEGKPGAYLIANPTPSKKADWAADQQKLQDQYDAERAKELEAKAAYDAKPAKVRAATEAPKVREAKTIKKPMPDWMQDAQSK